MALAAIIVNSYNGMISGQIINGHLENEDYDQIDEDELERMDILYGMGSIVTRARKYLKRTGQRTMSLNRNSKFGFDMSKVRCHNCDEYGHFKRTCTRPTKPGFHNPFHTTTIEVTPKHVIVEKEATASGQSKALTTTYADEVCVWSILVDAEKENVMFVGKSEAEIEEEIIVRRNAGCSGKDNPNCTCYVCKCDARLKRAEEVMKMCFRKRIKDQLYDKFRKAKDLSDLEFTTDSSDEDESSGMSCHVGTWFRKELEHLLNGDFKSGDEKIVTVQSSDCSDKSEGKGGYDADYSDSTSSESESESDADSQVGRNDYAFMANTSGNDKLFRMSQEQQHISEETEEQQIPLSSELPSLIGREDTNVLACVDDIGTESQRGGFGPIIAFLKRSRIFKAITAECTPYYSHQRTFWEVARVVIENNRPVILSAVNNTIVQISAQTIREDLGFRDDDKMPTSLPVLKVRRCLKRCGYAGDITKAVKRTKFSRKYRYFTYVLLRCLSPMQGVFDEMSGKYSSMFVALVLNADFNFSQVIFDGMVLNVEKKVHLVFPWFLQIMLEKQIPEKRLIGHLANEKYVCPEGLSCQHENSTSGDETDITIEGEEEVNQPPPKQTGPRLVDEDDVTALDDNRDRSVLKIVVKDESSSSTTKSQPKVAPTVQATGDAGGSTQLPPTQQQQTPSTQQVQASQRPEVVTSDLTGIVNRRLIQLTAGFAKFQKAAEEDKRKRETEMSAMRELVDRQQLMIDELEKNVGSQASEILALQTQNQDLTERLNEWEKKIVIEEEDGETDPFGTLGDEDEDSALEIAKGYTEDHPLRRGDPSGSHRD
ncbi:uncharacterized protein [Rutidosis leptorrhynchoides]|uniref:uncharacterized protein n=1 Tax=Rutidosis leptorrhynchoides TaxID=125765 RepID=UPI003A99CAEB